MRTDREVPNFKFYAAEGWPVVGCLSIPNPVQLHQVCRPRTPYGLPRQEHHRIALLYMPGLSQHSIHQRQHLIGRRDNEAGRELTEYVKWARICAYRGGRFDRKITIFS